MMYTAKWIVKNTKQELIYSSLSNFWSLIENDESAMVQHSILNRKYGLDRGGFLAKDGKSVVWWIGFKDEEDYKKWLEEYKKLPPIDKDLTWEKIDKLDEDNYYPFRNGKPFTV